jgi:phage portal protein BeeE
MSQAAATPGLRERVAAALVRYLVPHATVIRGGDSALHTSWGGIEWTEWMRGGSGGPAVGESTARSVSAVVGCTNLIGGSIASVPLHFYKRTKEGRERASGGMADALWWLLNERPHRDWSAAAWWQYMSDARLLHGDAFARIERGGRANADAVGFEPWHPSLVDVDRVDSRLRYTFWPKDKGDRPLVLEADDVLHIPGPGFDGRRSISQLRYGLMYPAGIASVADQQAATLLADGARPGNTHDGPRPAATHGATSKPRRCLTAPAAQDGTVERMPARRVASGCTTTITTPRGR